MERRNCLGGQILQVDLSAGVINKGSALQHNRRFFGGRGVSHWLLLEKLASRVSPFDPENMLLFGTGALVGTLAPTANRLNVASKNALTGGIGAGSAGGYFAPELRFAGYDHLILAGRAEDPVYIWINNDQVEIRNAKYIWGKTTWEAEDILREELGDDVQIASIGPAGENLVRAACVIVNRSRAVGRCGLGAVMGSKNLKAIAVRGTGSIGIEDPERLSQAVRRVSRKIASSAILKRLNEYGSIEGSPFNAEPVKNFQDGYAGSEIAKKICGKVFHDTYEVDGHPCCFGCPVRCGHSYEVKEGMYAGTTTDKLEANTLADFGYRLDLDYAPAIIKAHALCSEYGLDIDNSSSVIAWAFECYEKGIISKSDTDGLELKWGNHQAVMELLKKIAYREGFGNLLAEGCCKASEILGQGSENYCIHIKGQELMEGIRPAKGWALGVVVSDRGGTHTRGAPLTDLSGNNPTAYGGKARIVVYYERLHAVLDSLGLCYLTSNWMDPELPGPDDYGELFSAATGMEMSGDDLMRIGEQIHNLGKIFNIIHAGFRREDDYPPERLMREPVKSGPFAGQLLEKAKWDGLLDEYYELHGWDKRSGWPTRKSLESLGLKDGADLLEKAEKLTR
jgi:aldehyde:ferredoxin oxidoreductase